MPFNRHQTPKRADQAYRRINPQQFTRTLTRVLQAFSLLDINGIGNCKGIAVSEAAITIQQVLFDGRRHADKTPVAVDEALGLTPPVKTVVLAEAMRNTDTQRYFQPAIEL